MSNNELVLAGIDKRREEITSRMRVLNSNHNGWCSSEEYNILKNELLELDIKAIEIKEEMLECQ